MTLNISAAKGKRHRGQKRSRQETNAKVKNGETKSIPSGQHKRFDDEDDMEGKQEKGDHKDESAKADEDEPTAKQSKVD